MKRTNFYWGILPLTVLVSLTVGSVGAYGSSNIFLQMADSQQSYTNPDTLPAPPAQDNPQMPVIGQLTGLYTTHLPKQISLRVDGVNTAVPLAPNAQAYISRNGEPGVSAKISDLKIGDQIRVKLNSDGSAAVVEVVYGVVVGTVKSVTALADGSYSVCLSDGTNVKMESNAIAKMAGRHVDFSDIMPAEHVLIKTNQSNTLGYELDVETESLNGGYEIGAPHGDHALGVYSENFNPIAPQASPALHYADFGTSRNDQPTSSLEHKGPIVNSVSPAEGSVITESKPVIYALLGDTGGAEISQSSLRMLVDGADVTRSCTVTPEFIIYQPSSALTTGRHIVELAVGDAAGNAIVHQWSFSTNSQRVAMVFTSNHAGRVIELRPGDTMVLTLHAQPGGAAFATLGSLDVKMSENTPGVYTGKIEIQRGLSVQDAPVTAHFTASDHTCLTASLQQTVCVGPGTPLPPTISSPSAGQQIGTVVAIAGVSNPGATVDVTIGYSAKALGVLPFKGTAAETQVIADETGKWQTDSMSLAAPKTLSTPHQTDFVITAVAIDALGQHSRPSSVKVMMQ